MKDTRQLIKRLRPFPEERACKNCEYLQKAVYYYCRNQPFDLDPEHMSCNLFKPKK